MKWSFWWNHLRLLFYLLPCCLCVIACLQWTPRNVWHQVSFEHVDCHGKVFCQPTSHSPHLFIAIMQSVFTLITCSPEDLPDAPNIIGWHTQPLSFDLQLLLAISWFWPGLSITEACVHACSILPPPRDTHSWPRNSSHFIMQFMMRSTSPHLTTVFTRLKTSHWKHKNNTPTSCSAMISKHLFPGCVV